MNIMIICRHWDFHADTSTKKNCRCSLLEKRREINISITWHMLPDTRTRFSHEKPKICAYNCCSVECFQMKMDIFGIWRKHLGLAVASLKWNPFCKLSFGGRKVIVKDCSDMFVFALLQILWWDYKWWYLHLMINYSIDGYYYCSCRLLKICLLPLPPLMIQIRFSCLDGCIDRWCSAVGRSRWRHHGGW